MVRLWYLSSRWELMSRSWADFRVESLMLTEVSELLFEKRNEPPAWNRPGSSVWFLPTAFWASSPVFPDHFSLTILKRLNQLLYVYSLNFDMAFLPIFLKLSKRAFSLAVKLSLSSIFSFVLAPLASVLTFREVSMFCTPTASIERFLSFPVDSSELSMMLTSFLILELLTTAITAAPEPPCVGDAKSFLRTVAVFST